MFIIIPFGMIIRTIRGITSVVKMCGRCYKREENVNEIDEDRVPFL